MSDERDTIRELRGYAKQDDTPPALASLMLEASVVIAELEAQLAVPTQLDRIRASGWAVAIHNDYELNGDFYTFWLFTRGNQCAKGEGPCDLIALNRVEDQILMCRKG